MGMFDMALDLQQSIPRPDKQVLAVLEDDFAGDAFAISLQQMRIVHCFGFKNPEKPGRRGAGDALRADAKGANAAHDILVRHLYEVNVLVLWSARIVRTAADMWGPWQLVV